MRVVVIGTGFGKHSVAPAFEANGCEVQVVSPRDEAAVKEAISRSCDLVSIHSPPFMHLQHVQWATEHGCHVLCDKPFGCNAAEAEQMLQLAEQAGVRHFLNFEFRFEPQRQKLKELLDVGAIGTPQHYACSAYMNFGRDRPYGWLCDKNRGGGWIGAYASHVVDALHWMFGEISEVQCLPRIDVPVRQGAGDQQSQQFECTAEDALIAQFRLANGMTATLDTAFAAPVNLAPRIVVLGSEGSLECLPDGSLKLKPVSGDEQVVEGVGGYVIPLAMKAWAAEVCQAIATAGPLAPDFSDGLRCARILDKMRSPAG